MSVAYEKAGSGPALVLVHGVGTRGLIWRRVLPYLTDRFTVLTPDLPGFGDSPAPGSGFDLDQVADQLADGLAEPAGGPFDLVGHSLGGAIAVKLASRHPDLVSRLVLSAPAGFAPLGRAVTEAAAALAQPALAVRRRLGSPLVANRLARRLLLTGVVHDGSALTPDDARVLLTASEGATRLGAAVRAVAGADLRPDLSAVGAPLGVIWGERDLVLSPATIDTILAVTGPLPVERIAGAGHVIQIEKPAELAAALERVLERIGDRDGSSGR